MLFCLNFFFYFKKGKFFEQRNETGAIVNEPKVLRFLVYFILGNEMWIKALEREATTFSAHEIGFLVHWQLEMHSHSRTCWVIGEEAQCMIRG